MLRISEYTSVDVSKVDQSVGSDFFVVAILLPLICIARFLCERIGASIFLSSNVAASLKSQRKSHALKLAVKKFEESFWKCFYYSIMASYGLFVIPWQQFVQTPFGIYPNLVSSSVYWYYMIQISFYIWMSVCLFWDVRKKDFNQMAAHHGTTLGLMVVSYSYGLTDMGSIILLLSDIADPFLELAKLLIYLKKDAASNVVFAVFFLNFVGVRLFIYPLYAIYPAIKQTYPLAEYMNAFYVYYIMNFLLLVLFCLNVFWSVLIVKVLIKTVKGRDLKDDRSDSD